MTTKREMVICAAIEKELSAIEDRYWELVRGLNVGPDFDDTLKEAYRLIDKARCLLRQAYVNNTPSREEIILKGERYNY